MRGGMSRARRQPRERKKNPARQVACQDGSGSGDWLTASLSRRSTEADEEKNQRIEDEQNKTKLGFIGSKEDATASRMTREASAQLLLNALLIERRHNSKFLSSQSLISIYSGQLIAK